MNRIEFLEKYSDYSAAKTWLAENIETRNDPPVKFTVDGVCSCKLNWEKTVGSPVTVTDYEKTSTPVKRTYYTINYTEKDLGLAVEVKVTSYPNYPVVEYSAVLTNTAEKNSPVIKDLFAFKHTLIKDAKEITLHTFKGAPYSSDEYHPYEDVLTEGSTKHLQVTTGRPTSDFALNYNFENKPEGNGVLAVMGWAGKWKADFEVTEGKAMLTAGQFNTEFVLFPGESFRSPTAVLLFYKGEHIDGQNLYRRWLYEHNIMRNQGVRDSIRTSLCIGDPYPGMKGNAADDVLNIQKLKETGLNEYISEFTQDAGWYDCDDSWVNTGNWYPDPIRYPDGMGVVGEAAHDAGMSYHVWFEPERLITWRRETVDLKHAILGYSVDENGGVHYRDPKTFKYNETVLINYSIPEAVDYTIEFVNRLLDEGKIDIYRQDYNINPGPFWDAYDEHITELAGAPRFGITEEKYTAGYMRLWQSIIERHPGMPIDSCASGGNRNDLETIRYSYPHSRTDWWYNLEDSHQHTYGMAQNFVTMGGASPQSASAAGIEEFDPYQWRSETVTSLGFGLNFINPVSDDAIGKIKKMITDWKAFAQHMFYDFYPLTPYTTARDEVIAFEYNSPEKEIGMVVIYLRPEVKGTYTVYPKRLCENATYLVHDEDGVVADYEISGKDFMEKGITVTAKDVPTAPYFTYKKIR